MTIEIKKKMYPYQTVKALGQPGRTNDDFKNVDNRMKYPQRKNFSDI